MENELKLNREWDFVKRFVYNLVLSVFFVLLIAVIVVKAFSLRLDEVLSDSMYPVFKKSDVVVKDFLVECKTAMAEKSQFTIKKDWLEKLKLEALANHKSMYALAFNFGGEEKHNYFVINEQQFKLLKDLYSEKFSN